MRHTIYDIARIANCSVSTVSKALNNKVDVGEKTRQRILEIAKEVNYIPSANARATSQNKSYLIGVLLYDDFNLGITHPLFGPIIQSFASQISKYGYDVVIMRNMSSNDEVGFANYINYRNLDGVFIPVHSEMRKIEKILETKVPLVTMDAGHNFCSPVVMSDNEMGLKLSVEHLYELGHRKIANIIANIDNNFIAKVRAECFMKVAKKLKLDILEEYIIKSESYSFEDAYAATTIFLKEQHDNIPSAIVAASDMMALGVIKAIKEAGYRVPEDISVIGFDNIEVCNLSSPRLTTINQNTVEIGKAAGQLLIDQIDGKTVQWNTTVEVSLIERDSVCRK